MMNNISENDRRTLRRGAVGVALIVVFTFVGMPAMDAWDALNKQIAEKQRRINAISAGVNDKVEVVQRRKKLEEKATLYDDAQRLPEQTPRMQNQIEGLPAYGGLTINRVEGLPSQQEELYYRSALSLRYTGTLASLQRFTREVEQAVPRLKIESLSITPGQDDTSKIEGSIVIASYAVLVPKSKPKAGPNAKRELKG